MHTSTNGKRRHYRCNFLGTVYFRLGRRGRDTLLGAGINISDTGMSMFCSHPLKEGQDITISNAFVAPDNRATVKWTKRYSDDLYRVGLEFIPADRKEIGRASCRERV